MLTGSLATAIVTKRGAYTLGAADGTILCNAGSGAITLTLPTGFEVVAPTSSVQLIVSVTVPVIDRGIPL